ncbi:MAG: hypothetical protein LBD24_08905 [Spirochaetaceae bacterium]|jgi:hypothetical protein|nr:hypothetical protein [Spirochaetaceae bacterium]
MRKNRDWLPAKRVDILIMARTWVDIIILNLLAWGIPQDLPQELTRLIMEARAALDAASPYKTNMTAKVVAAFNKLVVKMRFIKEHYFLKPPLTDTDFVALGLAAKDTKPTPAAPPRTHILLNIHYEGYNTAVISMEPMPGDPPADDDDYVRLVKGTMPAGGATPEQAAGPKHYLMKPPSDGEGLESVVNTQRSVERVSFPPEEGGMTAYFCARYVNSKGEEGPWGPVVAAIIPRADNPQGAGGTPPNTPPSPTVP